MFRIAGIEDVNMAYVGDPSRRMMRSPTDWMNIAQNANDSQR